MILQIATFVILAIFVFAIIKVFSSFIFKKKIELVKHDIFEKELNEALAMENQVLVVFENGYWEIKEETTTTEWSATVGTVTTIDFDTDINDKRYKKFMGKSLVRDHEGEHELQIIKEFELNDSVSKEELLAFKI
jgi:hypothetical protein